MPAALFSSREESLADPRTKDDREAKGTLAGAALPLEDSGLFSAMTFGLGGTLCRLEELLLFLVLEKTAAFAEREGPAIADIRWGAIPTPAGASGFTRESDSCSICGELTADVMREDMVPDLPRGENVPETVRGDMESSTIALSSCTSPAEAA